MQGSPADYPLGLAERALADGNFTDRGTKEDGVAILALLEDDWSFHHTLHGTQTVVLDEATQYQGAA